MPAAWEEADALRRSIFGDPEPPKPVRVTTRPVGRAQRPLNLVIFEGHVWRLSAQELIDLLWAERRPGSPKQMILTHANLYDGDSRHAHLRIEHTVRGGYPDDVERMLRRTARRLGHDLQGGDVHVIERDRQFLPDVPKAI